MYNLDIMVIVILTSYSYAADIQCTNKSINVYVCKW